MHEKEVFEIEHLIDNQNEWRKQCINLIASENVVSSRVRSQAGSDFAHRYAEGHPVVKGRVSHGPGKHRLSD